MKGTRLKLIRLTQDKNRTQKLGMLFVFYNVVRLFECYVLEPFDSIPAGYYQLKKYPSPSMKRIVLLYENVPGRSFIEIHAGNFRSDTKGCQLVGSGVQDINDDGLRDVVNSNATLDKLLSLLPDSIQIDVFENPLEFNISA